MSHDPATIRILAADDHPQLREVIAGLIADESDMTLVVQGVGRLSSIEAAEDPERGRPRTPRFGMLWRSIVLVQEGT